MTPRNSRLTAFLSLAIFAIFTSVNGVPTQASRPLDTRGGESSSPLSATDTQKNNALAAQKLNEQFASMAASDPCQDGAMACIDGKFGQCTGAEWQLSPCASGTSCFALPLVNKPGTSISCDAQEDTNARFEAAGVEEGTSTDSSGNGEDSQDLCDGKDDIGADDSYAGDSCSADDTDGQDGSSDGVDTGEGDNGGEDSDGDNDDNGGDDSDGGNDNAGDDNEGNGDVGQAPSPSPSAADTGDSPAPSPYSGGYRKRRDFYYPGYGSPPTPASSVPPQTGDDSGKEVPTEVPSPIAPSSNEGQGGDNANTVTVVSTVTVTGNCGSEVGPTPLPKAPVTPAKGGYTFGYGSSSDESSNDESEGSSPGYFGFGY